MRTSQRGIELLKRHEGCRLTAYRCPAGVWTIGYGHTGDDVREGMTITQLKAEQLLTDDLRKFEEEVERVMAGVSLTQGQFDALTVFAYNVGAAAFRNSTLARMVRKNPNNPLIRGEFRRWIRAKGEVLPGLVRRREEEANVYFGE